MITQLIQSDMDFRRTLENFLQTLNPNINWNEEMRTWINKNKTDEQIYELIRSATWIDQNEDIDEHLLDKYILISKSLSGIDTDHVRILDYNKQTIPTKIEQEMELYRRIIEEYLTSRRIAFEYTNEVYDGCIDFGWICRDDVSNIWENKTIIHIDYHDLNKSIPFEYIDVIQKIYLHIQASE